jgi:hypothetical protein
MQYTNDPVDGMVDDIKGTAGLLAKVLFAGFNIVFILVIGFILVSNLAIQ